MFNYFEYYLNLIFDENNYQSYFINIMTALLMNSEDLFYPDKKKESLKRKKNHHQRNLNGLFSQTCKLLLIDYF